MLQSFLLLLIAWQQQWQTPVPVLAASEAVATRTRWGGCFNASLGSVTAASEITTLELSLHHTWLILL